MHRKGKLIFVLALAIVIALVVAACAGGGAPPTLAPAGAASPAAKTTAAAPAATAPAAAKEKETKGDPAVGKQLIVSKGCSACHIVPGMPEAKGTVGPDLSGFAGRPQIAGTLPNNPENLEKWLKNPPGVKPGTQMPSLGLSDKETENLSAFLYTLK